MKYFIDTEFLEGSQKYGMSSKPTIDLISIGIVCEDGREYYAISKDFNLKEAWNRYDLELPEEMGDEPTKVYWIRDNVLKPIFVELFNLLDNKSKMLLSEDNLILSPYNFKFTYRNFKKLIKKYGKSNKQIAEELKLFTKVSEREYPIKCQCQERFTCYQCEEVLNHNTNLDTDVKFYAYYADYDWVVFCWLFGKMNDLPKGFPMYCIDLKQTLDEKNELHFVKHSTFKPIKELKDLPNYPKQTNKHNALADARWNYELYKFLITL